MKLLHTADWHLGKKLEGKSQIEEQKRVLSEILRIVEKEKIDVTPLKEILSRKAAIED